MRKARVDSSSPTRIAREFNLRYHGNPVTTQSVRKWLSGKSLPAQDKVRVLAEWLEVPAQWLRFGEGEEKGGYPGFALQQEAKPYKVDPETLTRNFSRLSEPHRKLVLEIIRALLRGQK
ncbi:MAG: hypothetical protein HYU77_14560 [Betaproteobacteria bacterium]|nr:hypothetical protein [Betaproteobacteria bacterium]